MKSKKIFILLAALGLSLAACNPGTPGSGSSTPSGGSSSNPSQSTDSGTSDSGQQTVAVTGITLNKVELSLEEGKDETLTATVAPDNASNTKVTWASSNEQVATVSTRGKVTAVKVGKATITVTSESNPQVKATCEVTVTEEGGKYGSVNKPKTVAQILAIAAEECKNANDQTAEPVYVKGIVWKAPTNKDGFSQNIYLKDAVSDEKDLLVYSANHDALKVPYKNDQVVLHGYLMNYSGTIEISNVTVNGAKVYPEIDAVTRGDSTITYNVENGAVNADAPKSAKNNSEFSFSVTPESGYKVDRVAINGDAVEADANGLYKGVVKGDTTVNIDITPEGVEIKTAIMAYPGGPDNSDTKNMEEGNNAATVGLDATIFEVVSTNTTGIYAGLNKSGEIRLYDNRKATDPTQIANGTTVTVSSRKVTITKIVIELTSASEGDMEVKAGDQVVTGNEGTYQINNGQFSIQNVSRIDYDPNANDGKGTPGKQIIIKKITISYSENAEVAATAITVSPKTLTLKPEETGLLSAALTPANATSTVSWKSSDEAKATVDAAGKVTAVAEGSATITAFVDADGNGEVGDNEVKDTAVVTVEAAEVINYGSAEAPLTVDEAKAVIDKTGTSQSKEPLFVKGIVSSNTAFSSYGNFDSVWLQSNDGKTEKAIELFRVKYDAAITNGPTALNALTGYEVVAKGFAKIYNNKYQFTTANSEPKNPLMLSITAPAAVDPESVSLDKNTLSLFVGETATLNATLGPVGAVGTVSWKSSDETKATVDANGKVTAVAQGSATITAFLDANSNGAVDEGELKAECVVTVNVKAADETESVLDLSTDHTKSNSESEVVWEVANVFTMSAARGKKADGSNGTAANNYLGGLNNRTSSRFYQFSTVTITPANGVTAKRIEFTATTDAYATTFANSAFTNATASANGTKVTVTITDGAQPVVIVIGGTCGFSAMTYVY